MKSRFAIRVAAASAAAAMSLACAAGPAGGMELWYRSEAKDWVEALPVGNGRLGAMAFGGGTYAKCLEEGVAFGALFPGEPELAHHADEFISLDSLRKNLRIFTYALISLACEEGA